MRRLTASLVTAAAATGALALMPLALAGSASAAAIPPPPNAYTGDFNWAGYVATIDPQYASAAMTDEFGWVQATFPVPKTSCSDSTVSGHKTNGYYSAAAFWVGLGGVNGKALEQAGIGVICPTKNSTAEFGAFYEMVPANNTGTGGWQAVALYRHGKEITIHAGDKITVDTWDDSTNSQESGKDYKPGQEYAFKVTDVTRGSVSNIPLQTFGHGVLGSDNTVEVVTEAINDGPWYDGKGTDYTGIAHFQPVSYSGITVGMNGGGYGWGIGTAESWTTALYYVHSGPVDGLLGTLFFQKDRTLISTGGLASIPGNGEEIGIAFTNYWHKF